MCSAMMYSMIYILMGLLLYGRIQQKAPSLFFQMAYMRNYLPRLIIPILTSDRKALIRIKMKRPL